MRLEFDGRVLWNGHSAPISKILASGDGSHVVLVAADESSFTTTLRVVRVSNGAVVSESEWGWVSALGPGRTGWIVSGAPRYGAYGVFGLEPDGSTELLVGGFAVEGIGIDGDRLLFGEGITNVDSTGGDFVLRSVALETARRLGPRTAPPTRADLEAVARAVFSDGLPEIRERSELLALGERMEAAWGEVCRSAFPGDTAAIESSLASFSYDDTLEAAERSVLVVIAAAELVRGGAICAGPLELARITDSDARPREKATLHALAVDPCAVGAGHLLAGLAERANGRTILLGPVDDAMAARIAEEAGTDAAFDHESASSADVSALFERHPTNRHLRREIAARLVESGQHGAALAALTPYASAADAEYSDVAAWLAVQVTEAGRRRTPADRLVRDARSAVERFPEELTLYYLLGCAYEARGDDLDVERARACFELVLDQDDEWSRLSEAASSAIERLETR
ncbi:MAG: hypothetical protein R3F34_03220 [Planctomycetota bacterium]